MRKHWVEKNVDLALLSRCAEDFFKGKGLKTKIEKSAGEYRILLASKRAPNTRENVDIRIWGDSSDFAIEFSADERARSAILFGYTTTMLGGGNVLLRGLRSLEALEKLEKEFWVHVEQCIERLNNLATR